MVTRLESHKSGFNFDNYQRNLALEKQGLPLPKAHSTGTTIAATVFNGGVVLGADTRATNGPLIADKNCEKISYIAPNIYVCGAGTAADTRNVTNLFSSQLELHRLTTGRQSRVETCVTLAKQMLFKYHGHVSAALIIGGYDVKGPQIFTAWPHGSVDSNLPYVAAGSGSLAAIGIMETRWRKNMERQEAIDLIKEAIEAGILNDLGSGSNINITIIEKDKTEQIHETLKQTTTPPKEKSYKFNRGTTVVLKESIRDLVVITEGVEAMDIS